MNLTEPNQLKSLLQRHGWNPAKQWGQHFLISQKVVEATLSVVDSCASILEVGPGPGVLTRPLSESGKNVIAVEIDPIAVSALKETAPKASILAADALQVDLGDLIRGLTGPVGLVSNMPYNITGPLLTRFAGLRSQVAVAVLMMQKEVGKRLLATKGDRETGSLTIFMQSQFAITKVIEAPPGAFAPPPKVDSVVLRLDPVDPGLGDDEERFFKWVRAGFTQPRKTLLNNLGGVVARGRLESWLIDQGFSASARPHEIGLDAWKRLVQELPPQ